MKTFFNNIKIIYRPEGIVIPYVLIGAKGARYRLVRNIHDHLLYSDKKTAYKAVFLRIKILF